MEHQGPLGHPPCGYVEMVEEAELTRFWSIYFISIITAEACDRHIYSHFSAVLSSLMTENVTHE